MADTATTTTTTPEPAAPGNPEPTPLAPAAPGADPLAGLTLSAEDRATIAGLQSDPKGIWGLLESKRAANAEAKALRLAREKAEALGYRKPEGHTGDYDPLASALDALAASAGATEKLAAVEFRATVLEQAARHGQLAHPEFLLFQAEQAAKAAGTGFNASEWIEQNKTGLLAPAFAAAVTPPPANSGNPAGGPPPTEPDLDEEIAKAEKEGRTLDAIALKRKKAGFTT